MFSLITKLTAVCDSCGNEWADEFKGNPFAADGQAQRVVVQANGWSVHADDRLWCPQCVAQALCAAYGHDWCRWVPCRCRGSQHSQQVSSASVCGLEYRYCGRGLHYEERHRAPAEVAA